MLKVPQRPESKCRHWGHPKDGVAEGKAAQDQANGVRKEWETKATQWDVEARRIRKEYIRDHPPPRNDARAFAGYGEAVGVSKRKTNVSNCVVLDFS